MSTLADYTSDEIKAGVADLMFHLVNPRLDPIIWRIHGGWDTNPEVA